MCDDCACSLKFAGMYCQKNLHDAFHALKHKCDPSLLDPEHCNNAEWVDGCNMEAGSSFVDADKQARAELCEHAAGHLPFVCETVLFVDSEEGCK